MGTSTPYTWLDRTTTKHGIRFCDIHSIRHYFASKLILGGIDIIRVSSASGHSSIATTQSTYLHEIKEYEARNSSIITDKISAALGIESTNCSQTCKVVEQPPQTA
ncbi:MAG: tyrosine-type recombinase/integrase [Ruminiclostridium sp.]|nr:tyrosine-type recombinase/integrase [Ruminiclostridium sp.]